MASFRDPRAPDTLRFPGNIAPRVLIVSALFVNLVCAALSVFIESPWHVRVFDALLLLALTWFELRSWPGDITSNPQGLRQLNMFGKQVSFLPWSEIQAVEEGHELGGPAAEAYGLATDILIIRGGSPGRTITHTPRHPDRARLRREFQTYKVSLPTELTTPSAHPTA